MDKGTVGNMGHMNIVKESGSWNVRITCGYKVFGKKDRTVDIDNPVNGIYKVWSDHEIKGYQEYHHMLKKTERRPYTYKFNKTVLLKLFPEIDPDLYEELSSRKGL